MEDEETIGNGYDAHEAGGIAVAPSKAKPKRPPMYRVLLVNDDFTPMEFVVYVLRRFFKMNQDRAIQLMMRIHMHGSGVCGVFTKEIAETKVANVNEYSRTQDHPLLCTMEKD